jgi:hypothetical protein
LPGPSDDAIINVSGAVVNYSSGATTVNSILDQDTLQVIGGSLTTSRSIQITSVLTVNGGALSAGTGITVSSGTLIYDSGTIGSTATLVSSALTIAPAATGAASFVLYGSNSLAGNVSAGQTLTLETNSGYNTTMTTADGADERRHHPTRLHDQLWLFPVDQQRHFYQRRLGHHRSAGRCGRLPQSQWQLKISR